MSTPALQLLKPVRGVITFRFGAKYDPPRPWGAYHNGLDIGAPTGTIIRSAADGQVIKVAWDTGGYGRYVKVRHFNGKFDTLYAHMQKNNVPVQPWEKVKCGQVLGYIGMTGGTTGPHLHLEVQVGGKRIDPEPHLVTSCDGGEPVVPPTLPPTLPPGEIPTAVRTTVNLNIRPKPTEDPVIATTVVGAVLPVMGVDTDHGGRTWYLIGKNQSGEQELWVAGWYCVPI